VEKVDYVDLNGEHGALTPDLNVPLTDQSLVGSYDLVTDQGTNEHVFNVAEAYRTMHRLAKVGGLLVNVQAVFRGNGYFLYDCSFFEGLAQANQYQILFASYIVTLPGEGDPGDLDEFHIPASADLLDVIDWSRVSNIGICYVFRKARDAEFAPRSPTRWYEPLAHPTVEETRTADLARRVLKRVGAKVRSVMRIPRSRS